MDERHLITVATSPAHCGIARKRTIKAYERFDYGLWSATPRRPRRAGNATAASPSVTSRGDRRDWQTARPHPAPSVTSQRWTHLTIIVVDALTFPGRP
jgi:hypothetical protein